jgi:hypothetical protein
MKVPYSLTAKPMASAVVLTDCFWPESKPQALLIVSIVITLQLLKIRNNNVITSTDQPYPSMPYSVTFLLLP